MEQQFIAGYNCLVKQDGNGDLHNLAYLQSNCNIVPLFIVPFNGKTELDYEGPRTVAHENLLRFIDIDVKRKLALYEAADQTVHLWLKNHRMQYKEKVRSVVVQRQSEDFKTIIRGLLNALLKVHECGFCTSREWTVYVHENKPKLLVDMCCNPKLGIDAVHRGAYGRNIARDFFKFSRWIRETLFPNANMPVDVQFFVDFLKDETAQRNSIYLTKNCALMDSRERMYFFVAVIAEMDSLGVGAAVKLRQKMSKILDVSIEGYVLQNWTLRIPTDSLVEDVLVYDSKTGQYGNVIRYKKEDNYEHYKFLRDAVLHMVSLKPWERQNAKPEWGEGLDINYIDKVLSTLYPDSISNLQRFLSKESKLKHFLKH